MKEATFKTYPQKFIVPPELRDWNKEFKTYQPVYFVSSRVLEGPPWADREEILDVKKEWKSFEGEIQFDKNGYPLNPKGRTGLSGRGVLGKWGANFASDVLLVYKDDNGQSYILLIQRKDNLRYALPGGMVDEGEDPFMAAKRELFEETSVDMDVFDGKIIYQGYVDDPRNTDNAWIETTVIYKSISLAQASDLNAHMRSGDDAFAVLWHKIDQTLLLSMHANHADFVRSVLPYV